MTKFERIVLILYLAFFLWIIGKIAWNTLVVSNQMLIDATPVCAPKPVNPCATQRCEQRVDTRRLT